MIKGVVAIVGRPNVGKSTLFNRLTKQNSAIVDDRPGVTRDRLYGISRDPYENDDGFFVIDTGGFEKIASDEGFSSKLIWQQTEMAIEESDLVVLVFDAKQGLHAHDHELVRTLLKMNKKTLFVANKVDGIEQASLCFEFYQTGVENILTTSAAHNRGVAELFDSITEELAKIDKLKGKKRTDDAIDIAIVGRPNAGKSSILNRLAGEQKAIVSDVPGTTRDAIDYQFKFDGQMFTIIDTAGIRRKSKIGDKIEALSVIRSLQAIERADVIVHVIDAIQGLTDQDARLISLAASKYKPMVLIVNKWDLIENKDSKTSLRYREDIYYKIKNMTYIPVMFISCLENLRVRNIIKEVSRLHKSYSKRHGTAQVNEILQKAVLEHTPSLIRKYNKRVKFYYATQVMASPPTIVVKCNVAGEIRDSYKRYLNKRFRNDLDFKDIPLRLIFRGKETPKKNAGKH